MLGKLKRQAANLLLLLRLGKSGSGTLHGNSTNTLPVQLERACGHQQCYYQDNDNVIFAPETQKPMLLNRSHLTAALLSPSIDRNMLKQGTTGPKMLRRPSSRGQQHGEGNVMDAAQSQGLQSHALRTSTMREGCPQQPFRELGASGLALGGLCGLSCPVLKCFDDTPHP